MAKSTQASEIISLTAKLAEQENRISSLEERLIACEGHIRRSDDLDGEDSAYFGYYGDDDSEPIEPAHVTPKRGRRPRIPPEAFADRRDKLVQFIELRWPDLVTAFNGRKTVRTLQAVILNSSPGAESIWAYKHLTYHIEVLREFLRSERYTGEPRQIANAMAGLPELAWRSSFDYGTKHPSPLPINLRAFVYHIRRRNPACLEHLQRDGVTPQSLRLLRGCCEECRRLATKPERLRQALQVGL